VKPKEGDLIYNLETKSFLGFVNNKWWDIDDERLLKEIRRNKINKINGSKKTRSKNT